MIIQHLTSQVAVLSPSNFETDFVLLPAVSTLSSIIKKGCEVTKRHYLDVLNSNNRQQSKCLVFSKVRVNIIILSLANYRKCPKQLFHYIIYECSHCTGKQHNEFVGTKIYKKVEEYKQTKQIAVDVINT